MFIAMRKTAMSSIIYEVLDFGTAVTDTNGNIAASGAGIPAFIAMCDKAVQAVLNKFDDKDINPGDIFATNDPYNGGVTHLNDGIVVMPVFSGKKRIFHRTPDSIHRIRDLIHCLRIIFVNGAKDISKI